MRVRVRALVHVPWPLSCFRGHTYGWERSCLNIRPHPAAGPGSPEQWVKKSSFAMGKGTGRGGGRGGTTSSVPHCSSVHVQSVLAFSGRGQCPRRVQPPAPDKICETGCKRGCSGAGLRPTMGLPAKVIHC